MVMEVDIVSKQLIKPTSSTPHHLTTHKLSFLDQFVPSSYYLPTVFFYVNQETSIPPADIIASNSIHEDHLSIARNDEGAYYVEARVNLPLCVFLNLPDSSYVSQLLPESNWTETSAGGYIAMIQVTNFACGGIAIGAFLSHVIVDAPAAATVAYPREATYLGMVNPFVKKGIWQSRRIVFDASAIASLKAKTASSSVPYPTRVEVVSALLSKCIMAASKAKSDIQKSTLITHAVNLRQRARPQVRKHSMGNFLCLAAALLVQHANMGAYEIDFGWGKPTWVAYAPKTKSKTEMVNMVFLMDTKMRNGIEAWEQHMVMLEQNQELLAFGILEPSPLNLIIYLFGYYL
ncbi:hypothetical protein V6Z11_A11G308300 [Gossypium hirsutum]